MKANEIFEFPNPAEAAGPTRTQRRKADNRMGKPTRPDTIGKGSSWADIDLDSISWAWQSWLPNGLLTVLAAEQGVGKSFLLLRLAACFIRPDEYPLPDGARYCGEPGAVLWCEAEAAQAINRERAKALGLPLDKLVSPLLNPLDDVRLDNPDHRARIRAVAHRPDVKAIWLDSLSGAHSGDENSSRMIHPVKFLAELAKTTGKPAVLTHHANKPKLDDTQPNIMTLHRIRGSTAITQPARVVWAIDMPDPSTPDIKRLVVLKNNLSPYPKPLGLTVGEAGVTFGAAPELRRRETLQDKAGDLLKAILAKGPVLATAIENQVNQAGLSWNAAKRAKDKLGIVSFKEKGAWFWRLPDK